MTKITKDEYLLMYDFIGAAQEVHKCLGRAMEEAIYQESLEIELNNRDIQFEPQKPLHTYYKGVELKKFYVADFYSNGMIVEIKSVDELCSEHRAQLMNYMRITNSRYGILINFGNRSLRVERYIFQTTTDDFVLLTKDNLHEYVAD